MIQNVLGDDEEHDEDESDCACRDWLAGARASQSLVSSMADEVVVAVVVVVVVAVVLDHRRQHELDEVSPKYNFADNEEHDRQTSQHQNGD